MLIEPVETPNPDEWAYRVWVAPEKIRPGNQSPVSGTTLLRDFKWHTDTGLTGIADYVFTRAEGTRDDGFKGFLFAAPKTSAQMRAPFRTADRGAYQGEWPAILHWFKPIADYGGVSHGLVNRGDSTGLYNRPTYYAQWSHIPPTRGGSVVRREYFAPTSFDIPDHPQPVPTSVSVMMPGRETLHFGSCLHPLIKLDRMITAINTVTAGVGAGTASSIPGQIFQPTNFETWEPFVFDWGQEQRDGGWYYWEDEASPPELPDPDIQLRG